MRIAVPLGREGEGEEEGRGEKGEGRGGDYPVKRVPPLISIPKEDGVSRLSSWLWLGSRKNVIVDVLPVTSSVTSD